MATFREVIDTVLKANPEGMHYADLTKEVLKVKTTKGKTPDQTILAILSQDKERYEKVKEGVYRLKDTFASDSLPPETPTDEERPTTTSETESPKTDENPAREAAPDSETNPLAASSIESVTKTESHPAPRERKPKTLTSRRPSPPPAEEPALSSPVIEALISTAKYLGATTKKSARSSLGAVGKVVSAITLGKPGLKFDAAAAKEMFSGGAWILTHSVNLDELKEFLPENTVSPRAHRVQVWAPIKEAIAKYLPQVSAHCTIGRESYTVVGEETTVINVHDGEERLSCTCEKFDDSNASLCPHLLASIYTAAPDLATAAYAKAIFPTREKYRQWKTALENLGEESEGMKCNVLYYLIKDIATGFGFHLAKCNTSREAAKAFVLAHSAK
jgi:hypothetical protein